MKAIQIAVIPETQNFYATCIALGEDGRIFMKSIANIKAEWIELPELPDKK